MSMVEKLPSSQSEDTKSCSKCLSSDISSMYISGQGVLHCICTICDYEWVE